jgi:anti-sigma regulatory factor (Ser/Thr protein kinase)
VGPRGDLSTARTEATSGHGGFVHEALIYGSDEELLAVAVPFFRDGAAAEERTLLCMDDRQQRLVLGELADVSGITVLGWGQDLDSLAALRCNQTLLGGNATRGTSRVRMLGQIPQDPWRDWVRYEAALNRLCSGFPAWCICPYDARATPDDVLADVERTHPYLAGPAGADLRNPRYQQPAALLAGRARAEEDPLEALTPDVDLVDPATETARRTVAMLTERTRLDRDEADALRLSVGQVVANAIVHGRPPVRLRAWAAPDRVVVTVHDAGPGPADPFVGLVPREPDADLGDANSLHVIHEALSEVSLFADDDGFTVRLLEHL